MFGFGRKKPDKANHNLPGMALLRLLDAAAMEIHPERFPMPEDAGFFLQPKLVTLNRTLGLDEEQRFFSVNYEDIVSSCGRYEEAGLTEQVAETISGDTVIGAIIGAGHHEYKLRRHGIDDDNINLGNEIRMTAQTVINFLNQVSTDRPEPINSP